jgi:hypothetical protein
MHTPQRHRASSRARTASKRSEMNRPAHELQRREDRIRLTCASVACCTHICRKAFAQSSGVNSVGVWTSFLSKTLKLSGE